MPEHPEYGASPSPAALAAALAAVGWSRLGPRCAPEDGRRTWGFREDARLAGPTRPDLWLPARDEGTAMRLLLREVQAHNQVRIWAITPAAGATAGAVPVSPPREEREDAD